MDKNGVYNCILIQSKCPSAVIHKIRALKNYRNEALNSCRFITGELPGNTENQAFAITLADHLIEKNHLLLSEAETKDFLASLVYIVDQIEEKAKTKYKKRSRF